MIDPSFANGRPGYFLGRKKARPLASELVAQFAAANARGFVVDVAIPECAPTASAARIP